MELKIKPSKENTFPFGGFFIQNSSIKEWLKEIQQLNFSLDEIEVYPLPNTTPNSIWGCLILTQQTIDASRVGKNELCQQVNSLFFIPERTMVYPELLTSDLEKLFSTTQHVLHPTFGLVELPAPFNFEPLIQAPIEKYRDIFKPEPSNFRPDKVKTFQVKSVAPEDVLRNLEENVFPKHEKMPNKPLNLLEKAKLGIYRALFTSDKKNGKVEGVVRSGIMSKLEKLMNSFSKKEHQWADKLQQDFENLEERNQKKVDQLMDWLENNPEEALKYAIPLDDGTGRGELIKGQFDFARRWDTFSLFGGSGSALGGPTIDLGAHHDRLRAQYNKTAEELIKNGNHQKAAFVYLKLLKNNSLGAETLEKGGFYQEAATVYLKQVQNKEMAAHCYEKGRMTTEAIELYAELKKHEKVGDLYMSLQKKKEGISSYEKHVDQLTAKNKYVNASLVVRNKMGEEEKAQTLLIKGWDQNKEAYNCLNNYLSNVKEAQTLKREIEAIYANKVNDTNREIFLKVIHKEYRKNNEVKKDLKEMAYEIIAKQAVVNPTIVDELRKFNTDDREIRKDTIRFTRKRRKKNE